MRHDLLEPARGSIRGRRMVGVAAVALALVPVAGASNAAAPSVCGKVSGAMVSAVVGYTLPAATSFSHHIAASATNDGISADQTICSYGPENTIPELKQVVSLQVETTSRAVTAAEAVAQLKKTSTATLKITASLTTVLGAPAVYFTESGAGLVGTGLSVIDGTRSYGASVEKPITNAKLVALVKLAAQL